MSTLVAQTISNGTVSTSSANVIQGSAKAWVNWNGSGTIAASYNVTSITVNSTGNYTINFTNALADANYSFNGTSIIYNDGTATAIGLASVSGNASAVLKSTTQLRVIAVATNALDPRSLYFNSVSVFR
jgi:hypothetical protein